MFKENETFWKAFRQALLMAVDAVERGMGISPTTAYIRNLYKKSLNSKPGKDEVIRTLLDQ